MSFIRIGSFGGRSRDRVVGVFGGVIGRLCMILQGVPENEYNTLWMIILCNFCYLLRYG